jgi:hypothetical protein
MGGWPRSCIGAPSWTADYSSETLNHYDQVHIATDGGGYPTGHETYYIGSMTPRRQSVNPSPTVHRDSRGAIASSNAHFGGLFVSTLSIDCRAVSARLGTLLAQRGLVVRRSVAFARRICPFAARPRDPSTCGQKPVHDYQCFLAG